MISVFPEPWLQLAFSNKNGFFAKFSTLWKLHIGFLFLSLMTFFPTSPFSREAGFLRLLDAPWDAQLAFLPIDYFLRSLPL